MTGSVSPRKLPPVPITRTRNKAFAGSLDQASVSFSVPDTEAQMAIMPLNVTDSTAEGGRKSGEAFYRKRGFRFGAAGIAVLGTCLFLGLWLVPASNNKAADSLDILDPPDVDVPDLGDPDVDEPVLSPAPVLSPPSISSVPSPAPTSAVQGILRSVALQGGAEFEDESSYQFQALAWLEGNKDVDMYSDEQVIQRYAMACFFYSTFGVENPYIESPADEWTEADKWNSDSGVCEWHGVTCDGDNVIGIDLSNNNVSGTVPLEFGLLGKSLKYLDLSGNPISNKDEELAWIANLSELLELHAYYCNFDSSGISTYIGALKKIGKSFILFSYTQCYGEMLTFFFAEHLDMSYTLMFGSFNEKEVFAELTNLQVLELGGNSFDTSVPSEIFSLPNLYNFYIDNAMITGDLSFVASMPAIWELWVDSNEGLAGPIPSDLGSVITLESFSAADCGLSGTIPSELGQLTGMQQMWLHNNALTGAVPAELGNLVNMHIFRIEGNSIAGTMPTEVCENTFSTLGADCPTAIDCVCCTCCGNPCIDGVSGSAGDRPPAELNTDAIIDRIALQGGAEFHDPGSPQSKARAWIISDFDASADDASTDNASTIIQRYSLAVIYYSTNGVDTTYTDGMTRGVVPGWKRSEGWLSADGECSWYGVRCTADGAVDGLDLPSNSLTGGMPLEIVYLRASLVYLDISGNMVANKDAELLWLGELPKLTYLDISFCNFDYVGIPVYLANLVNLEVLDISYCLFFGEIEGAIFSGMDKLGYLEMGGNSYNSSIPDEIASLPELKYLYAEFTHLTGDLSFVGNMNKIVELWLDFNPDLEGEIPASIGDKTTLRSLSLTNCAISGTIPSALGQLTGMEKMWLLNNNLDGPIPAELAALTGLETLHLEGNDLTGNMPGEVCVLRGTLLNDLAADCKLPSPEISCDCCTCCGSPCTESDSAVHGLVEVLAEAGIEIDDDGHASEAFRWLELNSAIHSYSAVQLVQRFALASLYYATNSVETGHTIDKYGQDAPIPGWTTTHGWLSDDSECSWYNVTCDTDGAVSELRLAYNGLTGVIPPEISLLSSSLTVLDIGGNVVAGSLAQLDWIGALTKLVELDVHSCYFYFTGVPEGLSALSKLEVLDISYALFFGPLDGSVFAGLTSLYHLEMGGNSFNSSIPTEIASLPNLEFLYVENTDLTGDVAFIQDMGMLFEFWADSNPELAGSIPAGIGNVGALQSLSVSDCGLTGTIPSEIGLLTGMQQMWFYNNSLTGSIPAEISNLSDLRHFHTEGNQLSGEMPAGVCVLRGSLLESLATDCMVPDPEVECLCCTCCSAPCSADDGGVSASADLDDAGIDYSGRYQSQAANWLQSNNRQMTYTAEKNVQRFSLACIYLGTHGVSTPYSDSSVIEWGNDDGWLSDSDECTWYGIDCDDAGFVNAIDLSYNNVTGSFPNEAGLLGRSLKHLDISGNTIFNEDDGLSWISGLTKLTYLDIHFNSFKYDGVPPVFPSSLEMLDISYTLFHGELDGSAFERLVNLNYLDMGGNFYNSDLPAELVELPNLMYLYVQDAALTGDLYFVSAMPAVFELWIDSNPGIGGSIPNAFGQATTLASLSLAGCSLTGTIPSEMGQLTNMQQIWLYNNTLIGSIPSEMASLTAMRTFQTQSNDLIGEMPSEICALRDTNNGFLLNSLTTDCRDPEPAVDCDCCTCCDAPCYGDYAVDPQTVLETHNISYVGQYQSLALNWLQIDPPLQRYSDGKVLQRFALACFYYATYTVSTSYTDDQFGVGNNIPAWKNQQGWITAADECEWHGIECENGVVVSIKLPFNSLTGSMPVEIELLRETLTYIDLSGNNIASENEELSWIATLPKLTHLDVHFCNFAYDGIPPYIAALTEIEFLDISYTAFVGAIDGAIFVPLKKLNFLQMGGNSYNSPVPIEIFSLSKLERLFVQNSDVTGDLSFLANTVTMTELRMDNNPGLGGSIPETIGNAMALASLSLSACSLTGSIPSTIGLLTDMQQIWLYNNSLTGSIPVEISNLAKLRTLHTEKNDLSGDMPREVCALRDTFGGSLTALATDCVADPTPEVGCLCCTCCQEECYSGDFKTTASSALDAAGVQASGRYAAQATQWLSNSNSDVFQTYSNRKVIQRYALLCIYFATNGINTFFTEASFPGSPAPEWDNTTGWLSEDDECTWYGIECSSLGIVETIDLASNGLTGNFPLEVRLLAPGLEFLDLSGNVVTSSGEDLAWISSMTQLKHLDIHYCNFNYNGIPPYIANLTNLEFLDISYTLFHGHLDGSAFEGLTSLKYLEMGGNFYYSSIPTELASLPALENLYIESSHLTGSISDVIDVMGPNMFEFWFDSNHQFGGTLPSSIGNLTHLESLSLSNCGLEGSLPSEIGLLTSMQQMWLLNNTLTGQIPTEISNMSNLQIFKTEDNQMSGSMPDAVCDLRNVFGGSLSTLSTDCAVSNPEVDCNCCTCCESPCA